MSNVDTPDKIHLDTIEKESMIQNFASANEKLSSRSSIISGKAPTNNRNRNVNGNTFKNLAEILDTIDQIISNTELQDLKNFILKIENQMSALRSHEKCELSTLANKTKTMSLNLCKTLNSLQESVNKNVN